LIQSQHHDDSFGICKKTECHPLGSGKDRALIDQPGRDDAQIRLLEDYKTNLALYPTWQKYLRERQPKTLVVWGRNDPIFVEAGAAAYRSVLPEAEVVLLDTGHFALEEEAPAVASHIIRTFGS
jgi:pimeloyl-ACP methyl ester carboxylesterase